LPGPDRFQTGKLVERDPLAGRKDTRPALYDGLGFQNVFTLDRIDPKVVKTSKSVYGGKEANESLHERNVRGEVEDGVAGKVVRLELVEV
jgi:hypothetical protein